VGPDIAYEGMRSLSGNFLRESRPERNQRAPVVESGGIPLLFVRAPIVIRLHFLCKAAMKKSHFNN
jgi:hypothetical protein